MKYQLIYLFFIIIPALGSVAFAQDTIPARRIQNPPLIDGILDDKCWENAFVVNKFYQREPNTGEPISEKTEFYICYDSNQIYFGIKCFDDPDKITAKELARDVSLINDDRVQIILDTYLDHRNGYWFQIGPRGSIGDAIISKNGTAFNKKWDGLWVGKSKITNDGWQAEVAIPFKTLGFDKENRQWGIKLIRHIVRKLESGYWPVANLDTHKFQVSDAGILDGIENITQGVGLDISPYLLTGLNSRYKENTKYKLTTGTDLFYQVTPSLKASLSINTDFAETEVDDRQINLTRFSLHFPEKRDFFLDGANYFQFGIEGDRTSPVTKTIIPFFSRRLGLDSGGAPIPINVGAKLTGQADNWNIGLMHINEGRDNRNLNFTAARISKNIGEQSSIGMIGTYGNAIGEQKNLLTGLDAKLASSRFNGNKNIALILFGLISSTKNSEGGNTAWGAQVVYPNDLFHARLGYHQIGGNFVAGMGFVPRTNIKETYGGLRFGPRPNKWGVLQLLFEGKFDYITDFNNKLQSRALNFTPMNIRFNSGEKISYSFNHQYENLKKGFNIFSDFVIPEGSYQWWWHLFNLETKGSRNLSGKVLYGFGHFYTGYRKDIELGAKWKVAVPLFLGGKFLRSNVRLPNGEFTAKIYQLNANILVSPDITLYNFFQYDNESEQVGCQSRFQWILKPGNEIILVWTSILSSPDEQYIMNESTLRFKLKYNIRF
ncbi:MAG: carbohydrate binding family 9 domain-containing protein [Chlorobi bacterium]|nr:carbohydrate binding family 9 domain-containing protein [Chlorobiota bacterium]